MKNYQALAVVTLHTGLVCVNAEQLRRRATKLKQVGMDVYEIQAPIQFKKGEVFGYDGEIPKALVGEMVAVVEEAAAQAKPEIEQVAAAAPSAPNKRRRNK